MELGSDFTLRLEPGTPATLTPSNHATQTTVTASGQCAGRKAQYKPSEASQDTARQEAPDTGRA